MYSTTPSLEERLLKSESERKLLEAKFQYLSDTYKNEEEQRLTDLKVKYTEFLEGCKERSKRNEKIIKSLEKFESGARAIFAKTERLKQLRSHYDTQLFHTAPLSKQEDISQFYGDPAWIRGPSNNFKSGIPIRPAMLLPGGGAVMLPVVNEPPTNVSDAVGQEIKKPKEKGIASLGEAGLRMMRELSLIEGTYQVNPAYFHTATVLGAHPSQYQAYHLPIYIPPFMSLPITPTEYFPSHMPVQRHNFEPQNASFLTTQSKQFNPIKNDSKIKSPQNPHYNVEIQCLSVEDETQIMDDHPVDEELDMAMPQKEKLNYKIEERKMRDVHRQNSLDILPPVNRAPELELPFKAAQVHEKSITALKACLTEETPSAGTSAEAHDHGRQDYLDEDVPEEFNDQNYIEDSRFDRDVSRKVILEEDEEEEEGYEYKKMHWGPPHVRNHYGDAKQLTSRDLSGNFPPNNEEHHVINRLTEKFPVNHRYVEEQSHNQRPNSMADISFGKSHIPHEYFRGDVLKKELYHSKNPSVVEEFPQNDGKIEYYKTEHAPEPRNQPSSRASGNKNDRSEGVSQNIERTETEKFSSYRPIQETQNYRGLQQGIKDSPEGIPHERIKQAQNLGAAELYSEQHRHELPYEQEPEPQGQSYPIPDQWHENNTENYEYEDPGNNVDYYEDQKMQERLPEKCPENPSEANYNESMKPNQHYHPSLDRTENQPDDISHLYASPGHNSYEYGPSEHQLPSDRYPAQAPPEWLNRENAQFSELAPDQRYEQQDYDQNYEEWEHDRANRPHALPDEIGETGSQLPHYVAEEDSYYPEHQKVPGNDGCEFVEESQGYLSENQYLPSEINQKNLNDYTVRENVLQGPEDGKSEESSKLAFTEVNPSGQFFDKNLMGDLRPAPGIINQLLDSESESYHIEPVQGAQDDSDFEFSIGRQ